MESARQSLGLTEDPSDDHVTKLHRNQILTRECNYGVQSCIDMATSEFTNLMNNPDNYLVNPDLKTVVYCNALRYGGEEEWNFLWNRYLTHNVNTEQVLILGVLGCTRNETLAHGYLAKTINSDSSIRTQDLSTVSSSVYNNPYGVDFAISFLSQNYRQMIYFNNSTSTVTSLISNIAGVLSTQAQLNELRSFITNNSAELGTSVTATALNSLQTAQNNLDWLAEHGTTITNWLKSRRYRLPTDILPDRYVIELIPYIDNDNFTFNGRVEIFLDVAVATNAIRLHANDLDINATSVTVDPVVADGTIVKPTIQSQVYSEDLQIYTIILSDNLVVGEQYKLSISFLGHLRSDMQGFYRSYYDVEGERRWLASTQFQATHARRAFPCFDEPGFKSKFKISIARTEDRHALSNMPVESSIPDPALGLTWDHFEETPMPMSSYLVAFVVSDFVALNRTLEDTGVVYRNWQRAAAINQSMYSIDISPRIMTYLDNFTGIPYFLPKVDQVAVPDFSAGAMENWGLVTYRERNILHEVGVASAENKQRTADIISHEFAHKWFGNLVSPKWWGHLWLNEGFARYFQYFATAQVETDWKYGEQFIVRQVHQALSSDSLESSHPMTHEVSTPSEAWGMFSTISYAKGASVIRMAEHFLGSTAFQNGLQEYLSNHGNQTTEPDYLFNVLQSHATGIDVKAILDTWTLQKNYPVITVTRNYGTGGVTVRQERFLLRRSGVLDNHVYRWYVPLTYTTQTQLDFNTTSTKQWLPDFSTQATIGETVSANQWILFNIQQTGFYRVNYDAQNWALLANYLNSDSFTNIHVLNRAQLLDDAFNLARAEILDYTTALEITNYLSRETDYIPWYSALSSLSYLNNRLRGASEYDYYVFKNYLKVLLGRVYTEVGLEVQTADGHVAKLLRNSISTWACDLGDQTCIDFSRRELAAYMADPENYLVDPDVKSVVFCNGLRYGGEEEWNFLWGQYLKSEVSTEQVLILGILGCTNTESLAHRYLNLTITEDAGIRTQDIALVAPSVYNNPAGVDFAINYLFSYYQDIANYNGGSYSSVISLISGIGGALSSQNQYQRLRDFIEEADLGASAWNALATAERNLLWLETNGPSIAAWLRSQNYRLPETIVPDTYSVKLIPYLEGDVFTFDGEVLILVNVTTTTNRITLHVNDLEIEDSNVSVRPLDSADNLTLGVITRDEPRHFLDISVPAGLTAGQQYEVNIQYQGYMRDDMFGFYRSYYYVRGEKRWLGTTQFQPTHARRAFPSFDEPSFKAKFKMSIARPANYHALFNTRKIEQEIPEQTEDGRIWDHFEETPYMSTYLIAFVVSDFDNVTNAAGNVTIWQREEASPQASERLILWDEIVSTTSNKQTIATIVAHEIAHKWFGNLVTLQWWKYAWLNEGFATYFETFATALVEPDWRLEEQFVLMDHQSALSSDALETSRPMMYDVDTPSEIWSVFDFVNYAKAGTVIRMMEHFLTRDTFLKGLHTYLANHGYSNSEPDNLFAALQEQLLLDSPDADLNVKTVMDTWINQMGYPVVTVTRNYSSASASVSQERFLIQRNPDSTDSHDYKWWIPLSYTRKTGAQFNVTTPSRWLQANESQIVIENIADSSDWIIFNLQESAYYRVNYDANNWNSLISQLNSEDYTVIPPVNRAQLLDDSLNLARAGILDYATALSVTSYLSKESDYIPWASVFTAFSLLDRRLKGAADEDYQLFKNYVLNLIGDLYNTLGFDEKPTDHHLDKFLRSNVLTWACNLGLEDCINRSKEELAKQMSNASYNILADVSSTVYCNALRHGGHNEWNHLWARYMSSNVGTEQVLLLNVLGCSNNEHIINSYLSLSITPDSGIRSQDASSVFVAVYSNPAGVDLAFNFLRDNYQSISEFYGGMGSIGNILTGIAARLSTREQADALREFVEENQNNLGTALGASRRALETVEENLVWHDINRHDINRHDINRHDIYNDDIYKYYNGTHSYGTDCP
uniref:Aminopeptidase N n=1 Tax=Timema genevievae TaxID=629358 RepID=A0A7R9K3L4_TIMGE|nr:unnamed protein product [Timema genevievae]